VHSSEVRRRWAERSGEYSPAYYAHYGPDDTSEAIRAILARRLNRDARVLELGCSSGRHLAHLHADGFERLAGVELNDDAFDVMAEAYPELHAAGTFYADAIEDVVGEFADGRFDAVFSVETLQHVHPNVTWVFPEIRRITDDLLVTVENEGSMPVEDAETGSERDDLVPPADDRDSTVRYVRDGIPLYHRDWNRVFTGLGLQQVESAETDRDTIRAFRR